MKKPQVNIPNKAAAESKNIIKEISEDGDLEPPKFGIANVNV